MISEPNPTLREARNATATSPSRRTLATCSRCGYEWFTRTKTPVRCPSCKTTYWNQPRTYKIEGKPDPTRKAKARGATFSSETAQEAANIRHHGEANPTPEKPDDDAQK